MKKLLLLFLLGLVPNLVMAQTAKAIWCAGNSTLYFTYDNITYSAGGTYNGQTITNVYMVSGTGYSSSSSRPWNNISSSVTNVVISSNFNLFRPTSLAYWFYSFSNLTNITGSNYLNISNVTSLRATFFGCSSLTFLDVSNWNTGNVTEMIETFSGCSSLTSLDVSSWDTSNVTSLYCTFFSCISLTSLDVGRWNTDKVESLNRTFSSCHSLTSLDVSNWNTSNVTTMYCCFYYCKNLSFLNVSNWDISNVRTLYRAFNYCLNLFALDVNNWNTSNVENLTLTFAQSGIKSLTFGKNFNTNKVTSADQTFGSHIYIDFYKCDNIDAITEVNRSNGIFKYLSPRTIVYLPHGSQTVTDERNVVYSYNGDETDLRCPNYYSTDKISLTYKDFMDVELPRAFKTNKAEYLREFSGNPTYGSVVLPYDFTSNSNIQAFTLDEEHEGTMLFKNAATVPAHTPFAFQKLASGTTAPFVMEDATGNFGITVQATRDTKDNPYTATTNLTGWRTKGYYAAQTVDDYSDAFYISGDKIYKADGPLTLYPHRVTFHGTWTQGTPGTGAKNLEIADMATCITPIDNSQLTIDNCYDLSGRRVQSNKVTGSQSNMLPKGIYIVNGKKMVIK